MWNLRIVVWLLCENKFVGMQRFGGDLSIRPRKLMMTELVGVGKGGNGHFPPGNWDTNQTCVENLKFSD